MPKSFQGRDVALAVGAGLAVAGLAGLAAAGLGAAAVGTGMMALATTSRRSRKPLQPGDVHYDEDGRILEWSSVVRSVQRGGMSPDLRAELWPRLLGVHHPASTEDERFATLAQLHRLYIKLIMVCQELDKELGSHRQEAQPTSLPAPSALPAAVPPPPSLQDASAPHPHAPQTESDPGGWAPLGAAAGDGAPHPQRAQSQQQQPLPGNLASFAEAHRIIVMDAIRTDFAKPGGEQSSAKHRPSSSASNADGEGQGPGHAAAPTVTVLPVAVLDGLPELVFVEHPTLPAPADGAEGEGVEGDNVGGSGGARDAPHGGPVPPLPTPPCGRTPLWTSKLAGDTLDQAVHVPASCKVQMLRLINLLSAYAVHDPEISYCQGMSDIAAVFVQLFDDDALAFACFERLMRYARRNFLHSESGIKQQLRLISAILERTDPMLFRHLRHLAAEDCMFAYRMVIVMLRRELPAENVMTLWEVQWAHEAAAVLEAQEREGQGGSCGASAVGEHGDTGCGVDGRWGSQEVGEVESSMPRPPSVSSFRRGNNGGGSGGPARRVYLDFGGAEDGVERDGDFQHWFVAAVVRAQRWRLISECSDTDDVLRLFNSVKIDFWPTLEQAEGSFKRYAQGRAVMRRL